MEKKHMFSNRDLRKLLIPLVVEQILNSLMGTADSIMVSNVGPAAISAVSLVDSINILVIQAFYALAAGGDLKEELYLLYVSPLKSLAGDIRENLRRPLDGIPKKAGQPEIVAAMRTGDTPQKERQRMIKHPPHILITTDRKSVV